MVPRLYLLAARRRRWRASRRESDGEAHRRPSVERKEKQKKRTFCENPPVDLGNHKPFENRPLDWKVKPLRAFLKPENLYKNTLRLRISQGNHWQLWILKILKFF